MTRLHLSQDEKGIVWRLSFRVVACPSRIRVGFAAYRSLYAYYDLVFAVQVLLICLGPAEAF